MADTISKIKLGGTTYDIVASNTLTSDDLLNYVTKEEIETHEEIAATALADLNNKLETHEEVSAAAFASLNNKISDLDLNIFELVTTLPTSDIKENKIYLVPSSVTGTNNIYTEYKRVNGAWEKLGEYKSDVDLSEYAKKSDIPTTLPANGGTANKAKVLNNYYDSRPTTANATFTETGGLKTFVATSSMTEGKPTQGDSHILHMSWDTNNLWDALLAVAGAPANGIQFRNKNNGTWGDWNTVLTSNNYTDYTSSYLPLVGGTMTGTINSQEILPKITDTYNLGNSTYRYNSICGRVLNVGTSSSSTNYGSTYIQATNDWFSLTGPGSTTANESKITTLAIGNAEDISTTNAHQEGRLALFSAGTGAHYLKGSKTDSNHAQEHIFTNTSGYILLKRGTSAVGSSSLPVYINENGEAIACDSYLSNYLPLTGGTLTGRLYDTAQGSHFSGAIYRYNYSNSGTARSIYDCYYTAEHEAGNDAEKSSYSTIAYLRVWNKDIKSYCYLELNGDTNQITWNGTQLVQGTNVGDSSTPVYVNNGVATACTSLGADYLKATDLRNVLPNTTGISDTFGVKPFFVGSSNFTRDIIKGYDNNWGDLLVLDTWGDASGGKINALLFNKESANNSQAIWHFTAQHGSDSWGTGKRLAYSDETIDAPGVKYEPIFNTFYKYTAEYNKENATNDDWLVRIDLDSNWNNSMCELVVHPLYDNVCGAIKISRNDEIMVSQYNGNNALEYFGQWVSGDGIHIYLKLAKSSGNWNNETNGYVKVYASYPITITEITELPSGVTLKPIGTKYGANNAYISKAFLSDGGISVSRVVPNASGLNPYQSSLGRFDAHWNKLYVDKITSDDSGWDNVNVLTVPKKNGTLATLDDIPNTSNFVLKSGNTLITNNNELKLENTTSAPLTLKFHSTPSEGLDWTSEIVADYWGNSYNTTTDWTHGMYFVSGRQDFDNFIFLKNDKTPLFKIDKTGGFAATGESTINNNKVLHTGAQTLTDSEKTLVKTNLGLPTSYAPTNAELNVQSDWNLTNTSADDYIKNKPTIPTIPSWVTTNEPSHVKYTELTLTDAQKTQAQTNLGLYVPNYHINDLTNYRLNKSINDEFTLSYTYNGILCKTTHVWTDAQTKVFLLVGFGESQYNISSYNYTFYILVGKDRSDSVVSKEAILVDGYVGSKHQLPNGYLIDDIECHFYKTGQCIGLTNTSTELYAGDFSGITYKYTNPVTVLNIDCDTNHGSLDVDINNEEELHIFKVASTNPQVYISDDYKTIGDFSNFDTTKTYVLSLKSHIAIIKETN